MEYRGIFKNLIHHLNNSRYIINKEYNFSIVKKVIEEYYSSFKKIHIKEKKSIFKKIFILLPKNVPIIPVQLAPIVFSFKDSYYFFKLPQRRWKTSALIIENLFYSLNVEHAPLSHKETKKLIREFDFVIGFGSAKIIHILKNLSIPYRFFGPKFSAGFLSNGKNENVLKKAFYDFLSFDTEGCLSLRFLFLFEYDTKIFKKVLNEVSQIIRPQPHFNNEMYEYYSKSFVTFYPGIYTRDSSIIFIDKFPDKFPQRVLFVVKVKRRDEVVKFLKNVEESLQAFLYENEEDFLFFSERLKNPIFLKFGKSQFPPASWLFEKKVNIDNFFTVT